MPEFPPVCNTGVQLLYVLSLSRCWEEIMEGPAWNSWEAYYSNSGQHGIPGSYCDSGSHYRSSYPGGEPGSSSSPATLMAVADEHSCGIWYEGQKEKQEVAVPPTVVVSWLGGELRDGLNFVGLRNG